MAKRFPLALSAALLAVLLSPPVSGQSARARATASVDLDARFAEVQGDAKLADSLFKTGRKVAAVCAHCHGEGGNSLKPDIPNLAGQNPAYLLEQLRQFADGRRRNTFMEGMIKAMDADEKIGMVLFYAAQPVIPQPAADAALVARGQGYYNKVCFSCHGVEGRGNEQIARLAGQQPEYLRQTLRRYRTGTGPRVNPVMASSTRMMTDADIDAVAAYVPTMR